LCGRYNGLLDAIDRDPSKEWPQEFQIWLSNQNGVCNCAGLATINQKEIDVILKVTHILPIVSDARIKVKGSWVKGCIMSNLITRELIIKAGRIPDIIRGQ
jgi:hypothetical protein